MTDELPTQKAYEDARDAAALETDPLARISRIDDLCLAAVAHGQMMAANAANDEYRARVARIIALIRYTADCHAELNVQQTSVKALREMADDIEKGWAD